MKLTLTTERRTLEKCPPSSPPPQTWIANRGSSDKEFLICALLKIMLFNFQCSFSANWILLIPFGIESIGISTGTK